MPMSVIALVSWLRNPHKGRRSEVSVGKLKKLDRILIWVYSAIVTVAFYFILGYLGTKSLILSTVSVATSFIAAYLTFRRSAYFAFAYAINDVILILLWILASMESAGYVSVVVCFLTFLMNDLYTFFSWKKRKKRQISDRKETAIICN
jgi:nicotinamide mononucleotide transporter PnuC